MIACLRPALILLTAALLAACGASAPPLSPAAPPSLADLAPTATIPPTAPRTAPTVPVITPTPALIAPLPAAALATLTGTITIDGSSTVFPITEATAAAFRTMAPGVTISLGVSGTGGGFKKFCAGDLMITGASRPIKAAETIACASTGIEFVELPVAYDGLSVAVHPSNTWTQCLTTAELRRIWEPAAQGRVTTWREVRPTWPDLPLALYGAGSDSGTYDYFTAAIVGEEGLSRSDYTGSEDDYLIAQDLAEDPGGLGFFGYAYLVEYADKLRPVAIDNGTGCVTPTVETITIGSYSPLSRPIFIYVSATALDQPAVRAFVDFYLSNGPTLVRGAHYIPLPPRAYKLAADRAERRVIGSVFRGGSQIGISIEQLLELEGSD